MLRPTGRSSAVSEEVVDDWISFVESVPSTEWGYVSLTHRYREKEVQLQFTASRSEQWLFF